MFKKILIVFLTGIFTFSFVIAANAYSYWTSSSKIGVSRFLYSEPGDSDNGLQYSLIQRFNYHNNLFFAEIRGAGGYISGTYNGFSSGGGSDTTPVSADVHYKNWSVLGGAGIDYRMFAGKMQNQIYASLSENNMTWMMGNYSGGYNENYNTRYIGLNYKNIYAITPKLSTVFGFDYRYGIGGSATATNYKLYSNAPSETVTGILGGEWGYKALAGIRYRINNNLSLSFDLIYDAYFFKHSGNDYYYIGNGDYTAIEEPDSHTVIYGTEFGLHYDF